MTTTAPNGTIPDANKSSDQRQTKGNLHSLLKAYEQNHENTTTPMEGMENNQGSSDSISIQLDHLGRDRSSTLGSIRERGLTFGSEFDLGLGLTNDNVSQDAVFDLSAVNGQKAHVVSAVNSNASGVPADQQQTTPQDLSAAHDMHDNSSHASGFLNKMFNNNQSEQQCSNMPEHTPPTAAATSYETKHFGKRSRSGVSQKVMPNFCFRLYSSFFFVLTIIHFFTFLHGI